MTETIKAVLFDFGGVFTDSPFEVVSQFGQGLGLNGDEILEIVFGSYDVDGNHPWHCLERGEISLESAREQILAIGQQQDLIVDVYDMFAKMAENGGGADRRGMLFDRVIKLKEDGYRLAIITNNVKEFADGWRSLIPVPVDDLFECVIDSSVVGIRKPNPEIFQLALQQLDNIEPSQALFLDDYPANIETAKSLGMETILVGDDPNKTVADIDICLLS